MLLIQEFLELGDKTTEFQTKYKLIFRPVSVLMSRAVVVSQTYITLIRTMWESGGFR